MDINLILAREQVELVRAGRAADPHARAAHRDLAGRYRDMVDGYRLSRGASGLLGAPAPQAA